MRYVPSEEHALVVVAVTAVRLSCWRLLDGARRLPHGRNRARGPPSQIFHRYRENLRCRSGSGTGAEIRQPGIAMLAHADKRTAVTSMHDLVINRAQPNIHLLRRRKKCRL